MNIEHRRRQEVNTDPQRRCYNGCHYSSELVWTQWQVIDYDIDPKDVDRRLEFWRELNDGAIAARGEGARAEYRSTTGDE